MHMLLLKEHEATSGGTPTTLSWNYATLFHAGVPFASATKTSSLSGWAASRWKLDRTLAGDCKWRYGREMVLGARVLARDQVR